MVRRNENKAWDAAHATPGPPVLGKPGRESARRAGEAGNVRQLVAEMLGELRLMRLTMTEEAAKIRGQILNDVLEVGTFLLDAEGQLTRAYNTPIGSVAVVNLSDADVTVTSSPPTSSAPPIGRGIQVIPAGAWFSVPIAARHFTLYGAPGGRVSIQVFTGMQASGGGRP